MKKIFGFVMTLVFVLSLGTFAFAQNANSSTTDNSGAMSGNMGGMKMKHHRRRHHRRHKMHKSTGNMNGGAMGNGNMTNSNR